MKKEHVILGIGCLVFSLTKLYLFFHFHYIHWDEAVYLNMSSYIVSGGSIGFWEVLRPPLLPILLAGFSYLGDRVVLAELFVNASAIGCAVLLYSIASSLTKKYFAAIVGVAFLFVNSVFWNSSLLMTDVPSTFLLLLGVYFFVKERYYFAGLSGVLAFLMRFPTALASVAIGIALLLTLRKKKNVRPIVFFCLGWITLLFPWLVSNYVFFGGMQGLLAPLSEGSTNVFMLNAWLKDTTLVFYLKHLLIYCFPFVLLALLGVKDAWKSSTGKVIIFSFLLFFSFFTYLPHNRWRFAIIFLPFVFLLASIGAGNLDRYKSYGSYLAYGLLIIGCLQLLLFDAPLLDDRPVDKPEIIHFYETLSKLKGPLTTSDPVGAWYAQKSTIFAYYEFTPAFLPSLNTSRTVLYVPANHPCHPTDEVCLEEVRKIEQALEDNFTAHDFLKWQGMTYIIYA